MGRFNSDGEWDGDGPYVTQEMWQRNLDAHLQGPRGQRALRDIEASLLALPQPRLIEKHLAWKGEVCAVGAYVLAQRCAKGEDRDSVLKDMQYDNGPYEVWDNEARTYRPATAEEAALRDEEEFDESDPWHHTTEAGVKAGLTKVMAWTLGEMNDESLAGLTPEQRYVDVLKWVRSKLVLWD